jgi:drug/metabolite transporter (DMT)-like permease
MKMEGRWAVIIWVAIAVVGISGVIEAWPHASESVSDLALDAAILAAVVGISAVLARRFGTRGKARK